MTPDPEPAGHRVADVDTVRSAMRYSTLEGLFASQYVSTTTTSMLVGFLLALGASVTQVGIAAALPLLGGLFQPLGAELLRRRKGWRKGQCVGGVIIDDVLWLVSIVSVVFLPAPTAVIAVLCILALQQIPVHSSLLAWQSWISDLIPPRVRGRYFGRRNFVVNTFGAVMAIFAGQFVEHIGDNAVWSFLVVIMIGMTARGISAYFLNKQPEPFPAVETPSHPVGRFKDPFRHGPFRKYLRFISRWEFSSQIVAPFFIVYMLQDLDLGLGFVTLVAALATVANLISQQFWGELADRFGNRQVLKTTCAVLVIEPLVWLFTGSTGMGLYLVVAIHLLNGFASGGFLLANANLMMGLAPRTGQSSYFAVQASLKGVSAAAGPVVGGVLLDRILGPIIPTGDLLSSFGILFVLGFILRSVGLFALRRIPEQTLVPDLHISVLISEFARSFSSTQGFGLLLQSFTIEPHLDNETIEDALEDMARNQH
ncbi:MAG: MFS transporter [Rhodothermales bacterium]|nr:MFS transporter [Rhodothermales bacterium]